MKVPTIKSYFDSIIEGQIKATGCSRQHFAKWLTENRLYTHKRLANMQEYKVQAKKRKQKKELDK